jgi:DNA-binding protein Fis
VRELENTMHRAVLLASGPEIDVDAILSPDGSRLDSDQRSAVTHAAMAAEQVTRNLVGRTVAEVERDLILETLKHCLGNRTHAANILGISIRTLRNKLNEYSADGAPIPPPHGGEAMARRGLGAPRVIRHTAEPTGGSPVDGACAPSSFTIRIPGQKVTRKRTFSRL